MFKLDNQGLVHWNNSPWLDMSLHLDTLCWFWAEQSLLFTPKCYVSSREAAYINFILIFVWLKVSTQTSDAVDREVPVIQIVVVDYIIPYYWLSFYFQLFIHIGSNAERGARSVHLRVRFKSDEACWIWYSLNLTRACLRFNDFSPFMVWLFFSSLSTVSMFVYFE